MVGQVILRNVVHGTVTTFSFVRRIVLRYPDRNNGDAAALQWPVPTAAPGAAQRGSNGTDRDQGVTVGPELQPYAVCPLPSPRDAGVRVRRSRQGVFQLRRHNCVRGIYENMTTAGTIRFQVPRPWKSDMSGLRPGQPSCRPHASERSGRSRSLQNSLTVRFKTGRTGPYWPRS